MQPALPPTKVYDQETSQAYLLPEERGAVFTRARCIAIHIVTGKRLPRDLTDHISRACLRTNLNIHHGLHKYPIACSKDLLHHPEISTSI